MSLNNIFKLFSLFTLAAFLILACEINIPDPDTDDDDDTDTTYDDDDDEVADDDDDSDAEWKFEECQVYEGNDIVDCTEPADYYNGEEWCNYYMCTLCYQYNSVAQGCEIDPDACTTGESAEIISCYRDWLDCVMEPECIEDMTEDEAVDFEQSFVDCTDDFYNCSNLDSYSPYY